MSVAVDEDPGRMQQQQQGNMAVFMAMFLVCCIEAVIVKIATTEEEALPRLSSVLLNLRSDSPKGTQEAASRSGCASNVTEQAMSFCVSHAPYCHTLCTPEE